MRLAIVHDWLDTWGGAESLLAELLGLYPDATLFALVDFLDSADRARLGGRHARTSFVQRLPFARRGFRRYFGLFPAAVERLDLAGFDAVISVSHAAAKGVVTRPDQRHVCLCCTPARYAWDLQDTYLEQTGLGRSLAAPYVRWQLERFRRWDLATAQRVDRFVAISNHIADRIRRCYRRDAAVVYPPVRIPPDPPQREGAVDAGPYVTVTRLVPYKRTDLLVGAMRALPERELVVVGEGPQRAALERGAPANVRFAGRLDDAERDRIVAGARAFLFAAVEDFGIAPLEAQALGVPVIACRLGGTGETIRDLSAVEPTGELFEEQSVDAVVAALGRFEAARSRVSPQACRANAARFAPGRFRREFAQVFADALASGRAPQPPS